MSKKKNKKIDLSKYEHLFDGTWMLAATKIKKLEELISIVKNLQAEIPILKKSIGI